MKTLLLVLSLIFLCIGALGLAIVLFAGGMTIPPGIDVHGLENPILFTAIGLGLLALSMLVRRRYFLFVPCVSLAAGVLLAAPSLERWRHERESALQQKELPDLRWLGVADVNQTYTDRELQPEEVPGLPSIEAAMNQQGRLPILHGRLGQDLAKMEVVEQVECAGVHRTAVRVRSGHPIEVSVPAAAGHSLHVGFHLQPGNAASPRGSAAAIRISARVGAEIREATWTLGSDGWTDAEFQLPSASGTCTLTLSVEGTGSGESAWVSNPVLSAPEGGTGRLVIVYCIDALRADALSCYGYGGHETTTLDSLAARGARFANFFASSSWTRPSVASFLTATYPITHGAVGKHDRVNRGVWLLSRHMAEAGFLTAGFVTNGNIAGGLGFSRGFHEYVEVFRHKEIASRPGRRDRIGVIPWAEDVTALVLPWLERHRGEDVFLYVHTIDPHDPYTPPPGYAEGIDPEYDGPCDGTRKDLGEYAITPRDARHLRALYDACVRYADDELGRFLDGLNELGYRDNAALLITSDHGEEFLEHGRVGHGSSLFDEQIRIPLIVVAPGKIPPGIVVDAMAEGTDLAPTVCDLAGNRWPEALPGRSLLAAARGAQSDRRQIYSHLGLNDRDVACVRGPAIKLLWDERIGRGTLYSLRNDPGEKEPFAGERGEPTARRFRSMMRLWRETHARTSEPLDETDAPLHPETLRQLEAIGYMQE